jgi:SAM-dependent methyltransferase
MDELRRYGRVSGFDLSPLGVQHARARGHTEVRQARIEEIPWPGESFDLITCLDVIEHTPDDVASLRELRRVARRRVVLFNVDPVMTWRFWLTAEYLPGFADLVPEWARRPGAWVAQLEAVLGAVRLVEVPIPHDCRDGFYAAYWRRPEAYLDPQVRSRISVFHRLDPREVESGLRRLRADLDSGAWRARHADLLERETLDVGCRVVIAELGGAA